MLIEPSRTPTPATPGLLGRCCGLTMSDGASWPKAVKNALLFTIGFVGSDYLMVAFATQPFSDPMLSLFPVPVERVPYLVIIALVVIALGLALLVIAALSFVVPTGYNNSTPRLMKSAEQLDQYPFLFRLQSAHNNSLEFLAMLLPSFWAASELAMPPRLFAKLSVLALLARLLYVLAYALNEDLLRTWSFFVAISALLDVGFGAVFPESLERYGAYNLAA